MHIIYSSVFSSNFFFLFLKNICNLFCLLQSVHYSFKYIQSVQRKGYFKIGWQLKVVKIIINNNSREYKLKKKSYAVFEKKKK